MTTPQHKVLEKDVGIWDAKIEVLVGPAPSTSTGTMTSKMVGGVWLASDYVGDASASSPGFHGHGMWTWDAMKQKYVGVWGDTMMSFLAPGEGTWDPATKTMTFVYEARLPQPDGSEKHLRWKQTTESLDDDTRLFLSYMPQHSSDPAETPMMRATYTRRR